MILALSAALGILGFSVFGCIVVDVMRLQTERINQLHRMLAATERALAQTERAIAEHERNHAPPTIPPSEGPPFAREPVGEDA